MLHVHINVCDIVRLLVGFLQCIGRKLEKFEDFKCVSSFIVCWDRNTSALVWERLSNYLLFVSQLYKEKSLGLRAHDLIFFKTDLQLNRSAQNTHNCYHKTMTFPLLAWVRCDT